MPTALIVTAAAVVVSCAGAEPASQAISGARPGVETLSAAVAAGKVTVAFRGNGASSGDAVEATVTVTTQVDRL